MSNSFQIAEPEASGLQEDWILAYKEALQPGGRALVPLMTEGFGVPGCKKHLQTVFIGIFS